MKLKKRLIKRIKNKINKALYYKFLNNNYIHDYSEDDSDNNEIYKGISIHPSSNFILAFDLLLIIASLYYDIFIPLIVAKKRDIREKNF